MHDVRQLDIFQYFPTFLSFDLRQVYSMANKRYIGHDYAVCDCELSPKWVACDEGEHGLRVGDLYLRIGSPTFDTHGQDH